MPSNGDGLNAATAHLQLTQPNHPMKLLLAYLSINRPEDGCRVAAMSRRPAWLTATQLMHCTAWGSRRKPAPGLRKLLPAPQISRCA